MGDEAHLTDKTPYYWKVFAIDSYGATRESATWRFGTDNFGNDVPGMVKGYVRDAATNTPVKSTVTVQNGGVTVTTVPGGVFVMSVPAGSQTLHFSGGGFAAKDVAVTVGAGAVLIITITVTDNQAPAVTGFTVPATSASLTAPVTTLNVADNVGVTGYCLSETSSSAGCSWSVAKPATFTFGGSGARTLYSFARDAAGNVSAGNGPAAVTIPGTGAALGVVIAGSGGGSVNSDPAGIACVSGSPANCSASFAVNSQPFLHASPDWKSFFGGWSDGYAGNPTTFTMDQGKTVTATFTANLQARVKNGAAYASLQEVFNDAADGATIQAKVYTFFENLVLDRLVTVIFDGGKDNGYATTAGVTTIRGSLSIAGGTVVISGVSLE